MLKNEVKLELERIYKEYCNGDLEDQGGKDKFIDMMKVFVEFRLEVSGGSESSMGDIGMNYVSSFLDEIFLYDNMMDDWAGCYRGDLCYECFEKLEKVVNSSNLEENIKNEILEGYRKEYGMDEEEED
jgi:hypothetical protein